jgi:hypothetical protein
MMVNIAIFREHYRNATGIVIAIFHLLDPFGRTRALGSAQPLTEMSIRGISWEVKKAGA